MTLRSIRSGVAVSAFAVAGLVAPLVTHAQAVFGEGFGDAGPTVPPNDGPSGLIARGWTFRNQSQPEGETDWSTSDGGQSFTPHTGRAVLSADYDNTDVYDPDARISNWAILPAIEGQQAGDVMRFFAQGSAYSRQDRLQIRYSPSGGPNTGSGAEQVGDFTELLADIDPIPRWGGWTEHTVTVPGPGRLAFRYYLPRVGPAFNTGGFFGIDTLTVGSPPPGPYLIPQPGQTVTWTAAMSPIILDGNVVIPAGGTVLLEPGVEVRAMQNSRLNLGGTLITNGTPEENVTFTAPSVFPPVIEINGGTLELNFTEVGGQVRPRTSRDARNTER